MTYNVFGETLRLTQSIKPYCWWRHKTMLKYEHTHLSPIWMPPSRPIESCNGHTLRVRSARWLQLCHHRRLHQKLITRNKMQDLFVQHVTCLEQQQYSRTNRLTSQQIHSNYIRQRFDQQMHTSALYSQKTDMTRRNDQ